MSLNLEEIEKRAAAATPGPWIMLGNNVPESAKVVTSDYITEVADMERSDATEDPAQFNARNDADFIAHARTDIPNLIAEVKRLQADLSRQTARAERAEKRAEAAIRNMEGLCYYCKYQEFPYENETCSSCVNVNPAANKSNWQWRDEENEGEA